MSAHAWFKYSAQVPIVLGMGLILLVCGIVRAIHFYFYSLKENKKKKKQKKKKKKKREEEERPGRHTLVWFILAH
eukprot:SAG11_NODE_2672_length_3110_cov_2.425108_5_plen_75_part_00